MTRPIAGLAGFLLLSACVASPSADSADAVAVSTLAGLQTAIDNAGPGEIITLAAGTYHQTGPIRIHGRSNLTVRGATDDYGDTVIDGPGIDDASLQSNIRLNNADNITIENLTVADSYYHGIQINNDSDGFTARNVHTLDNGESGFKVTSPTNGSGPAAYSDAGLIQDCLIDFTAGGHRSVVEGVDLVGVKDWTLRGNTFRGIKSADGSPAYAAFAKGNSRNITFAHNTVTNSFIGLSFGGGGTSTRYFRNSDTRAETHGGTIRDNTIDGTVDVGIYMNKADGFVIADNRVTDNGEATGSINVRYAESNGTITDNRTTGEIKMRDDARADMRDNTRITVN